MQTKNLIIDTDIGTDVDDLIALAYAIKQGAPIKAITTVQGDTKVRAKIAKKLTDILGVNIPIISGLESLQATKYWTGIEELALTMQEKEMKIRDASWPMYEQGDILVCLGPLTNIAEQIKNNPTIKNIKTLYIMGHEDSHNLKVDPDAAKLVLSQDWTIYQITKQTSKQVIITKQDLEKIKGSRLGDFVYESAKRWLNYAQKENLPMYDPLTISAALNEEYVNFKKTEKNRYVSEGVDSEVKDKILNAIK
ncbi:nucleoside hydrolase [Candidatus Pacearchaeota archaeon]|nr:nucleoside hydrolase [Candidatus Pacearchaeota archaeon]